MNYTYEEYLKKFCPNRRKRKKLETPEELGARLAEEAMERLREVLDSFMKCVLALDK